jgi:hypothetical protein
MNDDEDNKDDVGNLGENIIDETIRQFKRDYQELENKIILYNSNSNI